MYFFAFLESFAFSLIVNSEVTYVSVLLKSLHLIIFFYQNLIYIRFYEYEIIYLSETLMIQTLKSLYLLSFIVNRTIYENELVQQST